MATQTTKGGFGARKPAAPAAAPAAEVQTGATKSYDDHWGDVVDMVSADGRKSKYIKFSKDISDPATGLFIPKGFIVDFETYQDIYDRTPNPTEKMLNWLNERQKPFTTPKGAVLTSFGQIKKPFKPGT